MGDPRTYPIIQHCVADILCKATEPAHIFGTVQESCDPPPFFQRTKVLENFVQFPSNPCTSDRLSTLEGGGYPLRIVLLPSSLTSPSGTGPLNDCASPSTRGTNDSIVWRHAIVCCDDGKRERHRRRSVEEMGCTSQ